MAGVMMVNITGRVHRLRCRDMRPVGCCILRARTMGMCRPMQGQRQHRQQCKAGGDALDEAMIAAGHWVASLGWDGR
jgi:hypothetical protein